MATSSQFLVPGTSRIWVSVPDGSGDPQTWSVLPHTVSWEITADVEDAPEIRTSDTDNKKVAACGGSTSFELNVTSALCDNDWLYYYLLTDINDPTTGKTLWFYVPHTWGYSATSEGNHGYPPAGIISGPVEAADVVNMRGPAMRGVVNAPGISFDNDASEVTVVEWTVQIQAGPYLPGNTEVETTRPRPLNTLAGE